MTAPAPGAGKPPVLRISLAGSGALLADAAEGPFDDIVQERIWGLARQLKGIAGVSETAPGMNNLLVVFDPFMVSARQLTTDIHRLWPGIAPQPIAGRVHEIEVVYGGPRGEDLVAWAEHCAMPVEEVVRRHAAATYRVAAIGAMAGFPYLSGLDPLLAWPRRAVPKARVEEGSVIIGASQASVMPLTAPSGWHIVGHADVRLFDPAAERPSLMAAGDTVRFVVAGVET